MADEAHDEPRALGDLLAERGQDPAIVAEQIIERAGELLQVERDKHSHAAFEVLDRWGSVIDALEVIVVAVDIIREELDDRYLERAQEDRDRCFQVLRELCADAVLVGMEIVSLLRNGYPAAALTRWRSLHEIDCVARTITAGGPDAAFRHLEHEVLRDRRMLVRLHMLSKRHPMATTPGADLAREAQREVDELLSTHEPEFGGDMGWAHPTLLEHDPDYAKRWERGERTRGPTIADVRRFAGQEVFEGDYMLASFATHASSKPRHSYAPSLSGVSVTSAVTEGIDVVAISSSQALPGVLDQFLAAVPGVRDSELEAAADILSALVRQLVGDLLDRQGRGPTV